MKLECLALFVSAKTTTFNPPCTFPLRIALTGTDSRESTPPVAFTIDQQFRITLSTNQQSPRKGNMPGPEVHHLFHHPIADHSFSADRSTLAVARENNVELYGKSGSNFKLQDELRGHDKLVTGVDIAPQSGRIVTCSQGKIW